MATFEEVKDLPNHPEKFLIDVRSADEILETGKIPTSINIPIDTLKDALELSNSEFKEKYLRDKPKPDDVIIFTCKLGGRAQRSTETAKSLGYINARTYKGSWEEWSKKNAL